MFDEVEEIYPEDWLKDKADKFFELMGIEEATIKVEKINEDEFSVLIESGKDDGLLIGRDGITLDSISHIFGKMLSANFKGVRVRVDIADYRTRREEKLREKVIEIASKFNDFTQEYIIKNLNPLERRIVHMTVKDFNEIGSRSEGDGFVRDVIIFSE